MKVHTLCTRTTVNVNGNGKIPQFVEKRRQDMAGVVRPDIAHDGCERLQCACGLEHFANYYERAKLRSMLRGRVGH